MKTLRTGIANLRQDHNAPSVAVVMGVSGAGKTAVGERLARRLGWEFAEGDRFHPPENVAKMQSGHPLDDADRAPWLAAIAAAIDAWQARGSRGVVTCSALKRAYRQRIIGDRAGVRLVYLEGSRQLIGARLAARRGHFMPASLLDSQFAALEPPGPDENPIIVSVDQPIERIVEQLAAVLSAKAGPGSAPIATPQTETR
ncbi:MAG TPA: gluconokinase [Stellaceae bacterium]|nr:gluconokinase [Stellaceae bacterium]